MSRQAAAAFVGAVVAIGGALAQGGFRGGPGNTFDPAVSTDQMERYGKILELSEDQQAAALALLEAYHLEFSAAAEPVRNRIEGLRDEARETRDRTLWGEIMQVRRAFEDEAEKMEATFLSQVQSLLTPAQVEEGWPRVERARRRERSVPRGLMSGERVDLIMLVDRLELAADERAALADALAQYELELDRALAKRDEVQDEFRSNMRDLMRNGDQETLQDLFTRGRAASTRVRDINNRFAKQVEAALAGEVKARFTQEFRQRSFPMIYNSSYADRVIGAAEALEDLTPEQKESLGTIRATFDKDRASINRQWESAQVRMEESFTVENMMEMWRGRRENDESRDFRRQRRELESATVERVRSILTEEQAAQLPERGEREEGEEGGRRGFGRPRGGDGPRQDGGEGRRPFGGGGRGGDT